MSSEQISAREQGIRLMQAGDFQTAMNWFARAVQEDPKDAQAYSYLGIAQTRLGLLPVGIASLQEAARRAPEDAGIQFNLAVALTQGQRIQEAQTALQRALMIDPNHAKARAALESLANQTPQPPAPPQTVGSPLDGSLSSSPMMGGVAPPPAPNAGGYSPYAPPPAYNPPPPNYGAPPSQPGYGAPPQTSYGAPPSQPPYGQGQGAQPGYGGPPQPGYGAPQPSSYAPPPQPGYGAPQPPPGYGVPPGGYSAPNAVPPGMHYSPQMHAPPVAIAPTTGQRILRGLGWGALYGQWWTLWNVVWDLIIYNHGQIPTSGIIGWAIIYCIVFTLGGAVVGLIIGAINARVDTGAIVGVCVGLVFLGLEILMSGNALAAVNIIFWIFTGRYIGANIAARVRRPVTQ